MSKNQVYVDVQPTRRFALCPTTVVAGDAVFLGIEPAVALNSYAASTGGATFHLTGSFTLTVVAATVVSPITGSTCNPGDQLYATGTLDTATNVTTGLTISKASGGTKFGTLDPSGTAITSGTTSTTATVRL